MGDLNENGPPRSARRRSKWIVVATWTGLLSLALLAFLTARREQAGVGSPASEVPSTQYATSVAPSGVPTRTHGTRPTAKPTDSSAVGVPESRSLTEFIDECQLGVARWRAAQVDYPRKLALEKRVPGVYLAAVDVREFPLPPAQVIPGLEPEGDSIEVKCALSARLVADESMTVDPPTWTFREFNPAGLLNWSWSVNASLAGARQLRLQLQPAVIRVAGQDVDDYPTEQVITYLTVVDIRDPSSVASSVTSSASILATPPAVSASGSPTNSGFWQSAADNWKVIAGIVSSIGAAVLGVIAWLRKVDKGVRGLLRPKTKTGGKSKNKMTKRKSEKT